jgi:hypothetical protein
VEVASESRPESRSSNTSVATAMPRRAENEACQQLAKVNEELTTVLLLKGTPFYSKEAQLKVVFLEKQKAKTEKKLKRLLQNRTAATKKRRKDKELADAGLSVPKQPRPGRPSAESVFPGLHQAIMDIVDATACADGRRRTEVLQSCRTLDDLAGRLFEMGFELSRTAVYLR